VGPDGWDSRSGLIRRDPRRLGFISRLGLEHLFLRASGLAAREPGSRRIGQVDEATRHPAYVVEQLAAFLPDRLGVGLDLAHARLRLVPAAPRVLPVTAEGRSSASACEAREGVLRLSPRVREEFGCLGLDVGIIGPAVVAADRDREGDVEDVATGLTRRQPNPPRTAGRAKNWVHLRDEYSTFNWLLEPMIEQAGFEIEQADYGRVRVYAEYICTKASR
jgi:hypothetical protein